MCFYKLEVCPYPHEDPVRALIFDPAKADNWEICDTLQPWGRLSCGKLVIEHPTDPVATDVESDFNHILTTRSNIPADKDMSKSMSFSVRQRRSSSDCTITPSSATNLRLNGTACPWCSNIIKLAATKSKEIHREIRLKIADLENKMDEDTKLRHMQQTIMTKEKELNKLKQDAWEKTLDTVTRKDQK